MNKVWKLLVGTGAALAVGLAAAQSGGVLIPTPVSPALQKPLPPVIAQSSSHANITLTIFNGHQNGIPGWPMFSPSYFVLPAHATVTVTIINYDNGPAPLLPGFTQYANVKGTVGNVAIYALNNASATKPNTGIGQVGPGVYSAIPNSSVSHTFTIPAWNVNVPVTAESSVTFVIHTSGPGEYFWQCFAPCGSGPSGMGGAMKTLGYMMGYIVVK